MKNAWTALRMLAVLTVITGFIYPFFVTGLASVLFPVASSGSVASTGGKAVGSYLLAQKFAGEKYFWPRPSGVDFNTLASGGSNLGPTSADLKKAMDDRKAALKTAHPEAGEPPQDLLFASGSGLDPHITPAAAAYQAGRVAKARGRAIAEVEALIASAAEAPQWGLLGEPRVNVLRLNLALDGVRE
jgi:K+-transporting ATPase ATPase C chain